MTLLTLILYSDAPEGCVEKSFPVHAGTMLDIDFWEEMAELAKRLEVIQRDGPWKPEALHMEQSPPQAE